MAAILQFGDCELDLHRRELRRAGLPRHLTPKAFELLALLVGARPRAVAKREILAALWPETFVSEGSVSVLLTELRRALGDDARVPRYLRTVHCYGLAFCAEVREALQVDLAPALCRLAWGLREFSLGPGAALIGRDPTCDVRIAVASLSRRHARLRVGPGAAVLEDLGSKNGCHVNGDAVKGSRALSEGDDLCLGGVALAFHWLRAPSSWDTSTADVACLGNL